jgi:hypothetical protein
VSEDTAPYQIGEPLETTEFHPQSMLQLWFQLTQALEHNPDGIITLASFADGLGIIPNTWGEIDTLPALLRQTQAQHGKA